ncbi:MAG: UDP-N-acetylmuramoyl-L-alanyl-D-glutamate--2,6-diaminopimelate ligase [Flavobacteriaceae bacterium]|nr:MAG: UDP-N-acetylmuramoyl-L-alanyl-D-glutamate--2,6-diaminopimelate ligase [Flavobacteriaceae bacterium]
MKQLEVLLKNTNTLSTIGEIQKEVNSLVFDSRKVEENDVFFAQKGTLVDGHQHIDSAIEKGAKTIVCQDLPETLHPLVTYIVCQNTAVVLGQMASNYYQNPSAELTLVGVTGTNGKTTTTTLLHQLFRKMGYKSVLISTIKIVIEDTIIPTQHTTPDIVTLNKILRQAVDSGCTYGFMEVSSHGIHQDRIAGLHFKAGGFTNITHDHLDYHKTFKEYIETKKRFFDFLPKTSFAISNFDDKNGSVMLQNTKAKTLSFALGYPADYKARIIEETLGGMHLEFNKQEFWTPLIGKFNAYNLLLVYGVCIELGLDSTEILKSLSTLNSVDGRFQTVRSEKSGTLGIVDYAHTPDALQNVLDTIHQIKKQDQKIITVMGCGGNRDKEKRPVMGHVAGKNSDTCILTSDNPRDEDPKQILEEIKAGLVLNGLTNFLVIENREEAIKTAVMLSGKNDIILVAGKGHETYQEIKGVKHPFDDLKLLQNLLNEKL